MVESFVKNPVKVAVGVLLLALFGTLALLGMPMQLTPEVETPTITIETPGPGRARRRSSARSSRSRRSSSRASRASAR
jgi:multidrug efflux pump subunit AcrB